MAISEYPLPLHFPYDAIRPQQEDIVDFIKSCLEDGKIGMIEAATGVGKTIAALAPLLDYISEYNVNEDQPLKILLLGRTHSQADRVIDEIKEIENNTEYKRIKAVSKRGRQSLCSNPEVKNASSSQFQAICASVRKRKSCRLFINAMIPDKTKFVHHLSISARTSEEIWEASTKRECCPAEISSQLLKDADVIAGSYHYLFSSEIRQRFLNSLAISQEQLIVVVDEAHNLSEATINMNAMRISSNQVENALTELKRTKFPVENHSQQEFFTRLTSCLNVILNDYSEDKRYSPLQLITSLEKRMMAKYKVKVLFKPVIIQQLEALAALSLERYETRAFSYIEPIAKFFDKLFTLYSRNDHLILLTKRRDKIELNLTIIDPSKDISKVLYYSHGAFLMTGTMGHASIFSSGVGLSPKRARILQLPSPYKQELGVYHVTGLTSKYTMRTPEMFRGYVDAISHISKAKVNIGLYVPSYSFLQELFNHSLDEISLPIFRAEQGLNSRKTEALIKEFKDSARRGGGILCSVMGGRSSEGADFPGKEMQIVIVVGIPYPPQSIEQEAKLEYFKARTKAAWDICNATPAFRLINQAAGRAVRSLSDRALIFLLDDRILGNKKRLTGWLKSNFQSIETSQIPDILKSYF